jgi:hypothetical protein
LKKSVKVIVIRVDNNSPTTFAEFNHLNTISIRSTDEITV